MEKSMWKTKRDSMISTMFIACDNFDFMEDSLIFCFGIYEIECGYTSFKIMDKEFDYKDIYSFSYREPNIDFTIGSRVNDTKRYGYSKGEVE